jgi:hypothetical protein
MAQQLVHQANDFLWCQRPPYVVVVQREFQLTKIELAQIMDSKMDSGYIAPGENLAQALEDDYDSLHVSHRVGKLTHFQCAHSLEQGERLIFHELPCT